MSARDIVALDEDNGLAVVTRRLIDEFPLFAQGDLISDSGSVNIPDKHSHAVTSILGVFHIVKWLYPRKPSSWPSRVLVQRTRPDDAMLDEIYQYNCRYWMLLTKKIPEYKRTLSERRGRPGDYRVGPSNHLLFRPAGQAAFARAVECLVSRGSTLDKAVARLTAKTHFAVSSPYWHEILWNPVGNKMLWDTAAAETMLLAEIGEPARSPKAEARLKKILQERVKK